MIFNATMPSVDILVNGQKRKIYGKNKDKIYLNDGDNFQLKIFNPLTTRIGMQLKMNSEVDASILVINPGQSIVVDRFIGTNKKMKFSTYVVDKNNPLVKQAISENGKLEITFWNENVYYNTITYTTPFGSTAIPHLNLFGSYTNVAQSGMANSIDYNTNFNITSGSWIDEQSLCIGDQSSNTAKLSETGRIEKGEKSNQHFSQTHFQAGTIICNYIFKLLPFSEKKVEATQPQQVFNPYLINTNSYIKSVGRDYCPNTKCNYRIRKNNWTFCPLCGTKIN